MHLNDVRPPLKPSPEFDSLLFYILLVAVMIVDDDLLIAASDVEFAFHVWQVQVM